jgi:DMSO/TMAO reductase YedYZ molybdopterin-dependent catalytic subunit
MEPRFLTVDAEETDYQAMTTTTGQAPSEEPAAASRPRPYAVEPTTGGFTPEEVLLASRNHAMPLELLRWNRTPAGMHYLLTHWDVPMVEPMGWRLKIGGAVADPLELSLNDLCTRDRVSMAVTLECAGNGRSLLQPRPVSQPWVHGGVSTAEWTGVPLVALMDEAGLRPDAVELVFSGADRGLQGGVAHAYERSLPVRAAVSGDVMLAYEMNGQPLPPQHGFPLRLVVPGWYGMTSVKWLHSIEATTHAFEGFQQRYAYRLQQDADDPGEPVTCMRVRSLMAPPGIPDFDSRRPIVPVGETKLVGRAWSGHGLIKSVQVSIDGRWTTAKLGEPHGRHAWRGWSCLWQAEEGNHELICRAEDTAGNIQPLEPEWNYQGIANNAVQRLQVTVLPSVSDGILLL